MFRFRWWLMLATLALAARLQATPPLTTIQDTLFTADGNRFSGVVTIWWDSFDASDASNVAAETRRLKISNGNLYVQLVPTTNATTAAVYKVKYSSAGSALFTEGWAVPPSTSALRVKDVRLPPGSVNGSTGPSTIVQMSDVIGLQNALNLRPTIGTGFTVSRASVINSTGSIDAAMGNLSDCLHVDGSSGPCGSGSGSVSSIFVDNEVPSGAVDGTNATFSLANAPVPALSLELYRNGLLLRQGGDYTLASKSVAFVAGAIPQPGDLLLASYRTSAGLPGVGFMDAEVPAGVINGSNGSFTLSQTPNPPASLTVYRNGLRMAIGTDYTVNGTSITFLSASIPQAGDLVTCFYRVAQ